MKKTTLITALLLFCTVTFANNVQVSTISYNAAAQQVSFTLTWENSWDLTGGGPPGNHDAVWVFIKCQTGSDVWSHAQISTTPSSHTLGNSLALAQPAAMNTYGVLIKRGTLGFGNINGGNNVSLQLSSPAGITAIQVFAIEMVYISEGAFGIGHSNPATDAFDVATISNENMIPAGSLRVNPADIPAAFPKGYKAFYVMKYEISQGQYTDFLNTLTRTQQTARVATDISGTIVTNQYVMSNQASLTQFNHIMCPATLPVAGSVIFSCGVPEKACNFLGWADYSSYLDWAGLRPFTEIEFEKICRGFDARIDNQFIWGTPYSFAQLPTSLGTVDADLTTETTIWSDAVTNPNNYANVSQNYITGGRLMRCGFPGSKPTNRILSGAAYFGAMEMAGNASEYVIQVLDDGLLFTNENGNGDVTDAPLTWPSNITASGVNFKGGSFRTPLAANGQGFLIHPRYAPSGKPVLTNNNRYDYMGGRGALSL
ncbi:hypothetical protein FAM09_23405 [Niastella caeni]|uniref:Sulfatase-modifying factor enzyme domain-containing protein n=1 Tax=Niastella caeni TaxID=2569763 RepID=A0A4S8HJZ3_9BACT|nr:hypothetical protein [Niastella caeni]THU34941.1 hypothetical protein FAM09_23405 [Niastella caeni]